jgi:hypothetical protein
MNKRDFAAGASVSLVLSWFSWLLAAGYRLLPLVILVEEVHEGGFELADSLSGLAVSGR